MGTVRLLLEGYGRGRRLALGVIYSSRCGRWRRTAGVQRRVGVGVGGGVVGGVELDVGAGVGAGVGVLGGGRRRGKVALAG